MWEIQGHLYGMFLTFSEVSKIKVQPFRRKKIICFSLKPLYHPEIDSLLENWENMTAAGSEKAHEAMGKVGDSSYLTTSKL